MELDANFPCSRAALSLKLSIMYMCQVSLVILIVGASLAPTTNAFLNVCLTLCSRTGCSGVLQLRNPDIDLLNIQMVAVAAAGI